MLLAPLTLASCAMRPEITCEVVLPITAFTFRFKWLTCTASWLFLWQQNYRQAGRLLLLLSNRKLRESNNGGKPDRISRRTGCMVIIPWKQPKWGKLDGFRTWHTKQGSTAPGSSANLLKKNFLVAFTICLCRY